MARAVRRLKRGAWQLETARLALEGGVASVSLCSPASLAKELFTYEGCGTFFTLTDYCQAERLALDDFSEAERLIERGEQEGALKKRSSREVSQLLLHGYGARLGTERDLVGFCALLPYTADNAAENSRALHTQAVPRRRDWKPPRSESYHRRTGTQSFLSLRLYESGGRAAIF